MMKVQIKQMIQEQAKMKKVYTKNSSVKKLPTRDRLVVLHKTGDEDDGEGISTMTRTRKITTMTMTQMNVEIHCAWD
jgi:hypothetical protein